MGIVTINRVFREAAITAAHIDHKRVMLACLKAEELGWTCVKCALPMYQPL